MNDQQIEKLRANLNNYFKLSDASFIKIVSITAVKEIRKNSVFVEQGFVSQYFSYLESGYMISQISNAEGKTYNKNIFLTGDWVGSTVSSLLQAPSSFTLKAITDCTLLCIPYIKFKELILSRDDLKGFYIKYLERNWVIDKELREVSFVMDSAQVRYEKLLSKCKNIEQYVSLKDIAAHIGVTPTQLSRIRRNRSKPQHM